MQAWQWLIVVLVVVILVPVVPRVLAKIDAKRQLRGDIPERKASGSTDGEILAGQARMKSGQNVMGMR